MRKMTKQAAWIVVAALTLCGASALATSLAPVNIAQIVENTDKAFVATVESVEVVQTPKGWAEKVTVKVSDPVLGSVQSGETVSWLQYRVAEQVRLPGMPKYAAGEEHLIFLAGKGQGTDFQAAYGLGQGSFRVHRELATGQAFVRNEFMNAQLFDGVNADLVATVMVEQNAATRSLSGNAKAAAATRTRASLANQHSGATDMEALKGAAKALATSKTPSKSFAAPVDASGKRSATSPAVLQAHVD